MMWLCHFIEAHRWSKWDDLNVNFYPTGATHPVAELWQQRRCSRCNRLEQRKP